MTASAADANAQLAVPEKDNAPPVEVVDLVSDDEEEAEGKMTTHEFLAKRANIRRGE